MPNQILHDSVSLQTQDGVCRTHVFHPAEGNDLPAVIMYMDAYGIRPAMFELAERLASNGYVAVLPDLYYRSGWTAKNAENLFADPEKKAFWFKEIVPTLSGPTVMRDVPALLAYLDTLPFVRRGGIGTTGYCLGGRLSITTAGSFPDRVAAAASYHAGGLATDSPESPHRLAPQMKAEVYVAGAANDSGFDEAQKQRLDEALTAAGVRHVVETYDALHGFVPSDTATHDPAAAERHWETMLALFSRAL